jgi:lysophospholipase L1-like esterase
VAASGLLGRCRHGSARGAKLARKWIGEPEEAPLYADGLYGSGSQEPLTLVMLGDSSAAGLGADEPQETPGALLAAGLAESSGRPVRLHTYARTGAQTSDLDRQIAQVEKNPADIAVILVGANDVTHRVRPSTSMRLLDLAVRRLREHGTEVVVATCPDLGTVEPVAQPLRYVARRWSRRLAAAQTIAVVEAGGRTVSLGDILGPEFAAAPKVMFGSDGFHPSAAGYRAAATAILPSVNAAMGLGPAVEEAPDVRLGEGMRSVLQAAAAAVETPGTEVAPAEVGGRERGPRGRWVSLRHRRRRLLPTGEVAHEEIPAGDGGTPLDPPEPSDPADPTDRPTPPRPSHREGGPACCDRRGRAARRGRGAARRRGVLRLPAHVPRGGLRPAAHRSVRPGRGHGPATRRAGRLDRCGAGGDQHGDLGGRPPRCRARRALRHARRAELRGGVRCPVRGPRRPDLDGARGCTAGSRSGPDRRQRRDPPDTASATSSGISARRCCG